MLNWIELSIRLLGEFNYGGGGAFTKTIYHSFP